MELQLLTFSIFVVIYLIRIWNSSAVIDHVIYTVIIVISVGVTVIAQSISVSIRLNVKTSELINFESYCLVKEYFSVRGKVLRIHCNDPK